MHQSKYWQVTRRCFVWDKRPLLFNSFFFHYFQLLSYSFCRKHSPACHTSKMFSSASWRWSWQSHDRLLMLGSEAVASVPASTSRQLFSAERRPQEAPVLSVFLHLSLFLVERVKLRCCVQVDYGPGAENATKIQQWERSLGEGSKYLTNIFQRTSGLDFFFEEVRLQSCVQHLSFTELRSVWPRAVLVTVWSLMRTASTHPGDDWWPLLLKEVGGSVFLCS